MIGFLGVLNWGDFEVYVVEVLGVNFVGLTY